jgi:hypothetical protein
MVRAVEIRETHDSGDESAPDRSLALGRPEADAGRTDCPRCAARLLFDGEKLACLMCGYEHSTARLRGGPRSPAELLDALPLFRSELIGYIDSLGAQPEAGSIGQFELERATPAEATALQFGRLFAHQSLVSAGHALIALARGLEPPTPEYGTWSVAQAVLNSTSLTCWILEDGVGGHQRAVRAASTQINDLEAEAQFLTCLLAERADDGDGFADALAATRQRRQEALTLASELGGVMEVPEPAERASQLGASFEYLMCTSILSGRPWALLHATAIQASGYEMDRASSILATQVQLCARWYARAVWAYASWMSRDDSMEELRASLEFGYDSLALPDEAASRFWRKPASRRRAALAS